LTSLITALITPGLSGDTETLTNVSAVSGTAGGADRDGHHVGQVIFSIDTIVCGWSSRPSDKPSRPDVAGRSADRSNA
jgi:hypothetical protein